MACAVYLDTYCHLIAISSAEQAEQPFSQGCGVGVGRVACFQLESESGVGFLKLLESESENLLQLPTPMFIK